MPDYVYHLLKIRLEITYHYELGYPTTANCFPGRLYIMGKFLIAHLQLRWFNTQLVIPTKIKVESLLTQQLTDNFLVGTTSQPILNNCFKTGPDESAASKRTFFKYPWKGITFQSLRSFTLSYICRRWKMLCGGGWVHGGIVCLDAPHCTGRSMKFLKHMENRLVCKYVHLCTGCGSMSPYEKLCKIWRQSVCTEIWGRFFRFLLVSRLVVSKKGRDRMGARSKNRI